MGISISVLDIERCLRYARWPDKGSINRVSGKIKIPRTTTVRQDRRFWSAQVPTAAESNQITDQLSQKPPT